MTRFLPLLLALAAGGASAQAPPIDSRDGPIRVSSLDSPMILNAAGADVRVATGTYSVTRLDAPVRLVADGGPVRLIGGARIRTDVVAAPEVSLSTPGETAFDSPFPNPFSRTATIPLSLSEAAEVDVRVVDVLGRDVARLAQGSREAGIYRLSLSADDLADGVYLVIAQIRSASGAETRLVQRITLAR